MLQHVLSRWVTVLLIHQQVRPLVILRNILQRQCQDLRSKVQADRELLSHNRHVLPAGLLQQILQKHLLSLSWDSVY